tara:strand:- start:304 stop:450 length:147 start_codon:yes stop_codon:yes gene_type:complete
LINQEAIPIDKGAIQKSKLKSKELFCLKKLSMAVPVAVQKTRKTAIPG